MYQKLIGTTVSIDAQGLRWNQAERCIRGKYEGFEFVVPTEELSLQNLRWNRNNFPDEIKTVLKNGFTGIVKSYTKGQLIISRKEWQYQQYNKLKKGKIYDTVIDSVTSDALYMEVNGLRVRVYLTECSRTRMNTLLNYFENGQAIKIKITSKDEGFPYRIAGSRKMAYPDITESKHQFKPGDRIYVMVAERLNEDGIRVEVTPNIPGILNAEPEIINGLYRGQRIKAFVRKSLPNGLKLSL